MPHEMERRFRSSTRENLSRDLRQRQTAAESVFWNLVRAHRFDGYHFRRQHPLGTYVADFYCDALKLVIELDGPIHTRQIEQDKARDENLTAYGLRIVRITNDILLKHPEQVLDSIRAYIADNPLEKQEGQK